MAELALRGDTAGPLSTFAARQGLTPRRGRGVGGG